MPHFTELLAQKIRQNQARLEDFFAQNSTSSPFLFYNSIDLRHCGFKIAPVDTNCFPAGFNNLDFNDKTKAKKLVKEFIAKTFPAAKKAIIIAENHTRNLPYFYNLAVLQEILASSLETRVATINEEVLQGSFQEILLENPENPESNQVLKIHRLENRDRKLFAGSDFAAEVALLNNDLTSGLPLVLQNCETAIFPSVQLGWFLRSKAKHFEIYSQLAEEVAKILEIDPWLISTFSQKVSSVNFKQQSGLENLASEVDKLLIKISEKYRQFGIEEKPGCFIKADNGTYGMAVWLVYSGDEIRNINKKERNKMNALKSSVITSDVIIQEAVPTIDKIDNAPCEPMIYMVLGQVVGYLFRSNKERDNKISLNASGAIFHNANRLIEPNSIRLNLQDSLLSYWLIATLASLAAAIEGKF